MELREVVEIASAGSGGRHVTLDIVRATVRPVDVAALAQVLTELVENAANASPSQGTIEVSAWSRGEAFALSVRDHGHGIPEELLRLINVALADASGIPDGAVSGLSNVARLARKHGMRVHLTSSTSGTLAEVELEPGVVVPTREPQPPEDPPGTDRTVEYGEGDSDTTTLSTIPSEESIDMSWPTTPALSYTDDEFAAVEEFLARIFDPLAHRAADGPASEVPREEGAMAATVTELRVRVPGTSFFDDPRDQIHSAPADGANEIRFALTSYDIGRDAALREAGQQGARDERSS